MLLLDLFVLGGICYAGSHILLKCQRKQKALWLSTPKNRIARSPKSLSTRVYIVRCWQERLRSDGHSVTRYSLDIPTTGERYGYANATLLLDKLTTVLTKTPRA
jgi:hypothetical protein